MLISFAWKSFAQNTLEKTREYFEKYKTEKQIMEFCNNSFPTIEDCKVVFKENDAKTFFEYSENTKKKMKDQVGSEKTKLINLKIETFNSNEINKQKEALELKGIQDKIQSDITFYTFCYQIENDSYFKSCFNFWVYIEDRWVFFSHPKLAFEN